MGGSAEVREEIRLIATDSVIGLSPPQSTEIEMKSRSTELGAFKPQSKQRE